MWDQKKKPTGTGIQQHRQWHKQQQPKNEKKKRKESVETFITYGVVVVVFQASHV